jgi:hypothetical protein
MSQVLRPPAPITSAAELSVWWGEVLSEEDMPGRALSLLWLDSSGHRMGRVLSVTGVPPRPDRSVVGIIRQLRDTIAEDSGDAAHLAIALSRPGGGRLRLTTASQLSRPGSQLFLRDRHPTATPRTPVLVTPPTHIGPCDGPSPPSSGPRAGGLWFGANAAGHRAGPVRLGLVLVPSDAPTITAASQRGRRLVRSDRGRPRRSGREESVELRSVWPHRS